VSPACRAIVLEKGYRDLSGRRKFGRAQLADRIIA
jgi:hypothetical protein